MLYVLRKVMKLKGEDYMKRQSLLAAVAMAALFLLTLGAPRASADTQYLLYNTSVSSSPLVTVNVALVGNTATITFTADQSLGIIDGSAIDLNVNGAFTLVSATTNTEALSSSGTGNVDHIGSFSLELSMQDASSPATSATVVLTGSWANSASVLTGNDLNNVAGVHFKTSDTCTFFAGNTTAGSAGSGCGSSVPDGGMTLMLLGGVLVGVETLRRKFQV
jgi:hypothetical protein